MATFISARPVVASESSGFADIVITLSAASASAVSFNYSWGYGSADSGDFTFSSGTLSFNAGETSKTLRVVLTNDTNYEPSESFYVSFSAPVNAVLTMSQAVVTIAASDASPGVPNASIRDVVVDEKAGTAQFVVMLDKPATDTVSVNYATADGNAAAGLDYGVGSGTLLFTPGQTTQTITIALVDDALAEGDELFAVNLLNPSGLVIVNGRGLARIGANDATNVSTPVISIEDITVDESAGYADIVVRLSAPSAQAVSAAYDGGYETAEYTEVNYGLSGTLVFAPGETVRTIRIDFDDDNTSEGTEAFYMRLSTPVNGVLGKTYAIAAISANDAAQGVPAASVSQLLVDEKAGVARFEVRLDKPSADPVTLNYATSDGSAVAGADFVAMSGSIGFLPGETFKLIMVPILDDATAEGWERFALTLNTPVNATLAQASASAFIAPSDNAVVSTPVVSVDSAVADEAAGFVDVVFRLSAPSAQAVTVNFTDSGSNIGANEYGDNYSGVLGFAPGETLRTVRYIIRDDSASDPMESWEMRISSVSNAVVGSAYASIHVAANDGASGSPVASIASAYADEKSGLAAFVITLDRPSTDVVSLTWSTAAQSATADADFTASSGAVSFLPGEVTRTVYVPVLDDSVAEGDETFTVNLVAGTGVTVAELGAMGWISANDATAVATPVIRMLPAIANESAGYADVLVQLSAPSAQQVSVSYRDYYEVNGANYVDYAYGNSGVLTFAPGETSKVIRYSLVDDGSSEGAETFFANLYTPTGAVIGNAYAAITIGASDGASGTPIVGVRGATVDEKTGRADFVVFLDKPSTDPVYVNWTTADGTAVATQDYGARAGSAFFAPGDTVRVVSIPILDDTAVEGDEIFTLTLSSPTGATLGQTVGTTRIVANDATNVATPVITIEDVVADETKGYVDVVIRLSAPSAQQVSVNYADQYLQNNYTDYNYNYSGTLVFAPGETAKTVRYAINDDTAAEPAESVYINLTTPVNALIGTPEALLTIAPNDDASGVPNVRINPITVDERAGVAIFTVLLDRPSTDAVALSYSTSGVTATAGVDFATVSGVVVFAPGETSQLITVPVLDDASNEPDEFFSLALTAPANAALAQSSAIARILASDGTAVATPIISAEHVVVDEGAGFVDIVLRLSAPSAQQVSVRYDDYYTGTIYNEYSYAGGGTVVFAPGEMAKTVRYAIYNDSASEPAESFNLYLDNPANAVIGIDHILVTMAANDASTGTPSVSVSGVTVDEKAGAATFVLTLSQPSDVNVSVRFATADGSAAASGDYIATSGTVGFAPGQTTRSITVPINDDSVAEADEYFSLVLNTPSGLLIGNPSADARIVANDGTNVSNPVITIEPAVINEIAGYGTVVVRLSAPSAQQVSVKYDDGYYGDDYFDYYYNYSNGALIFAPGETAKTVRFGVYDDSGDEGPEFFMMKLNTPVNAVIGTPYAAMVIAGNDGSSASLPSASLQDIVVDEKSGIARFVLTLDIPSTETLYFNFTTANGTALAGTDYVARSGVVSLLPGETTATVYVPLIDDATNEGDESFTLALSAPVGAGLAQGSATARIVANDAANVSTPQITCESVEANESAGYVDVVFRLSAPSANQVSFTLSDTYVGNIYLDYSYSSSGTVVFAPGETVKTVRYGIVDDALIEGTETFRINLATPVNATLANTQATVSIIDRDGGPSGAFGDNVSGIAIAPVTFTLTFSQDVTGLAVNDFNMVNGSITSLTGSGASYTLVVAPAPNVEGVMLMTLKMDAVMNVSQIGNMPAGTAQVIDTIVPVVTSFSPVDEATLILRETNIVVGFSQAVVFGSGNIVIRRVSDSVVFASYDVTSNTANLSLSVDGKTLTVNPSENLKFNTDYKLEWAAGPLRDEPGNLVVALSTYNFRTLPNTPPTAANTSGVTLEDTVLTATLPAFVDPDIHPVVYVLGTVPTKGSVTITTAGSYTYTPSANANGADSFTYLVRDEEGANTTYTVSLTVTPVNDAPTGNVTLSGTPQVGQRLSATSTLADADGLGTLAYSWLRGSTVIAGATSSTYDLTNADIGSAISARVSYQDGGGTAESKTSLPTATVQGIFNNITGTAGPDNLSGTAEGDAISGLAGKDTLSGLAGSDSLDGGDGDDVLNGGAGSDTLNGGAGFDVAVFGGGTALDINMGAGTAVQGSDGDALIAIEGIIGSSASDVLRGINDVGNPGQTFRGGGGNDTIDGGTGIDTAEFAAALANYTVTRTPGTQNISVTHNGGGSDGTDSLSNIEHLLFGDRLVAFGARAEEVARVAFVLWSPAIYASHTLFSKGISFYNNQFTYSFDVLCQVALQYHPEVGAALANKLKASMPASSLSTTDLLAIMTANGGGTSDTGRAAAVKAMALDAETTRQLDVTGVTTKGVVATFNFDAEVYFFPMAGG